MSEKSRRRQFPVEFKRRIVKEADASKAPGEVGALLRRHGLHSSHLSAWRAARDRGELARGATAKRRGPKAAAPEFRGRRIAEPGRQIPRLTKYAGTLSPREMLPVGNVDFLLTALNFPLIDSVPEPCGNTELNRKGPGGRPLRIIDPLDLDPRTKHLTKRERSRWRDNEEFCIGLSELVREFKEQISILEREDVLLREEEMGLHPTLRGDFFSRYERHRRLFQEMPLERGLDMTYSVYTRLSNKVGDTKLQQYRAIEQLFILAEQRKLDYLRKCGVCQRWYLATRPDKVVCSKACRQKKHYADPAHNQHRRENYRRKTHESRKGKRKHA